MSHDPSEQVRASFPLDWKPFLLEPEPAERGEKERLPDVRKGGEIHADGELVYKNGKWLK
ncbi:MAG: hypothetical protein KAS67_02220 [Thermoplasmata archaeon]|nr:hypothetical protein [Thermoplasmata archaeon]